MKLYNLNLFLILTLQRKTYQMWEIILGQLNTMEKDGNLNSVIA